MMRMKSYNGTPIIGSDEDESLKSAFLAFRITEEEINKKKMELREKVHAHFGRVEEETKKLAEIRKELEALDDPWREEVTTVRKKIDLVNKELKPLAQSCYKKEREYMEALESYTEKGKEKGQLAARLMELVTESERVRMKRLEELTNNIESVSQLVQKQ
ncbi:putative RAB6-interacting golgin [Helianthus annuus]|nr:putative RAB6-interacting golgin [Helianthus annuus]KAJ0663173.1 putative RAB6-interacting golgin [Helianthus annuus]